MRYSGQAAGYSGMAATDYQNIVEQQRLQDEDFSDALARFAAAITGGTGGTRAVA
jgi:hypothetical protein